MTTPLRKKLIEVSIPLEAINVEAQRRKQKAPKGYPTSIHKSVTAVPRQAFAAHHHTIAPASRKTLRERNLKTKIEDLEGGGLISSYLGQRLQAARLARNDLMHGAIPVAVTASGDLQTMVRDLWELLLDAPFELNAGYAMRV